MGYSQICFPIARERARRTGEPAIADWPIRLDTCQIGGTRKPRHVRKPSSVAGSQRIVYLFKIGSNLSEMEVRTFLRIQRVIWDHLLVLRLKLSRNKLYFSFRAEQHAKNNYELEIIMQSALFSSFVPVFSPPRSFFRPNHVRNFRRRCSIILGFFDRNVDVGLCCSCFSVAVGDRGYFR